MTSLGQVVLGLDYGSKRVGVALSNPAGFGTPIVTLDNSENLVAEIKNLAENNSVAKIVVGLPRDLNGNETAHTASAREFAVRLKEGLAIPVYLMDEAATSLEAEARLKAGKKAYKKGDIDALAAALILEDFLANERNAHSL